MFQFIHDFFIPKERNGYRAKALHLHVLSLYLLLAIVLTFSAKYLQASNSNVLGFATDITAPKLLELTNQERVKSNLPPLTYNEKLALAGQKKAADMFAKNYWAHFAPNGTTPWDFILASGYQYEFAGENLAKNFLFSQGVMDAWMHSPTHKENIMRKEYTEVGFAIVNGVLNGEETTLVVQMFGKPSEKTLSANSYPQSVSQITQSNVLAKETSAPRFNLTGTSFNIDLIFIGLLLLALIFDFYFASRMNLVRVHGKNLAHIIFVGFMLIGLFLITKGAIL